VKITVEDNTLVIDAERTEEKSDKNRSEFQYGAFRRAMALPAGAKVDDIKATYTDGILTVTIGIGETPSAQTKQIPVARGRPVPPHRSPTATQTGPPRNGHQNMSLTVTGLWLV